MMKKRLISTVAALMALVLVFAGCGAAEDTGAKKSEEKKPQETETVAKPAISGEDVFGGQRFSEMVWGYYEVDGYEYTGSHEDSAGFRDGMKYVTIPVETGEWTVSALPLSVQMGKYTHFMPAFAFNGAYHNAYTEEGRAMFRKAYMKQVGDLTEEDFQKIEKILWLDVAEMVLVEESGATRIINMTYELRDNMLYFYTLSVDERYNITTSDAPVLECEFLHDGGKLILDCGGVQRAYYASGYKQGDSSLTFSGYALNEKNKYADLDGFSFFQFGYGEEISVYVELSGGESPVDPVMDLDVTNGNFTLSWQQRWIENQGRIEKVDDPRTITGKIVPCTSYGFTDYSGFFMIVDGTCYRYLMSQEEYEERRYSGVPEDLSDSQRDTLASTKRNLLEELAEAFEKAGIDVTIDFESGKIDLEASFLFGTDSYEFSADGQAYVDAFMDVYISVVMKEDYAAFVSNIVVEGHTDTAGSYSYNKELSQKRAESVASRCTDRNPQMANMIRSEGYSYDYPVYNDDGSVNMEKSRRVTFSFVLGAQ